MTLLNTYAQKGHQSYLKGHWHNLLCAAIKHPLPDRVKPSFVIFDIRALWRSGHVISLKTVFRFLLVSSQFYKPRPVEGD